MDGKVGTEIGPKLTQRLRFVLLLNVNRSDILLKQHMH